MTASGLVDLVDAVGLTEGPIRRSWTVDDCLLYALAIGAGPGEPQFVTESSATATQQVVPSFVVQLELPTIIGRRIRGVARDQIVHAEQSFEVSAALPVAATVETTTSIVEVLDKGTAALVRARTRGRDVVTGEEVFVSDAGLFIRGAGGFGSSRVAAGEDDAIPSGSPDEVLALPTAANQALLYRLLGDRNPLHSDPTAALAAGFDAPILHGLCTFGIACRGVVATSFGGDAGQLGAMRCRLTAPVVPGEELTLMLWDGGTQWCFQVRVGERIVVDRGCVIRR